VWAVETERKPLMSSKEKEKKEGSDGNIQTFLRIRPSSKPSGFFTPNDLYPDTLQVNLPENYRSQSQEYINNSKLRHQYHFNGVITTDATQEQVFSKVGTAAVRNALDGFELTLSHLHLHYFLDTTPQYLHMDKQVVVKHLQLLEGSRNIMIAELSHDPSP
jgi:hypothetical protein